MIIPDTLVLADDGIFPNSKYPVLIYRKVFTETGSIGAGWLVNTFTNNNWCNAWQNGIYPFHHYHSTSHEVLGIYSGKATLQLGGEKGEMVEV